MRCDRDIDIDVSDPFYLVDKEIMCSECFHDDFFFVLDSESEKADLELKEV